MRCTKAYATISSMVKDNIMEKKRRVLWCIGSFLHIHKKYDAYEKCYFEYKF